MTTLIGIEIGGTKLQVVAGSADGQIFERTQIHADAAGGARAIIQQLQNPVATLAEKHSAAAVGVGFGGPVDYSTGLVIKSNHVSGWENFDFAEWSQDSFRLPAQVGNDTDVAALAEALLGAGQGFSRVFYTNIGSGIGGGLVCDGELYTQPTGAMEIGHSTVYSPLEQRYGILEDFCSGWSLNHRAQRAAESGSIGVIQAAGDRSSIDARHLFSAWQTGDEIAGNYVNDFLEVYSRTLANMIALLNPDAVVIGGGVAQVGEPLRLAVEQNIAKYVYEPFANNFAVRLAGLADQCVPAGALLLAERALT